MSRQRNYGDKRSMTHKPQQQQRESIYESIEPVREYEDVFPQGKASRANYVNIN